MGTPDKSQQRPPGKTPDPRSLKLLGGPEKQSRGAWRRGDNFMPCLQALGRGTSQEKVAVQAGCGLPSVLKDWWRPAGPTDCSKHTLLGFYELHRRWDLNTDPRE